MKANAIGYYYMGKDRFYVEFNENAELKLLMGWILRYVEGIPTGKAKDLC